MHSISYVDETTKMVGMAPVTRTFVGSDEDIAVLKASLDFLANIQRMIPGVKFVSNIQVTKL
jgi:hypothetical protein